MRVEIAESVTPELMDAMARLIPQLSSSNPPPGQDQVRDIVESPSTDLFVAHGNDGRICGLSTLVTFRIPTALRAWIEDVVVDREAQNQGIGKALNLAMLDRARELGAATVDLTSRPSREAANHLYSKIGFVKRETNVYRYQLPTPDG